MVSKATRSNRTGRWYAPPRGGYSAVLDEEPTPVETPGPPPKNPSSASPRPELLRTAPREAASDER